MTGQTAKELLGVHSHAAWRIRFADLVALTDILGDCIISDDYAVPDDLNAALILSERGNELKSKLIRREQVPAKEAHLMCALTLGHDSLYLDVDATDVVQLADAISRQIVDGEVRFPYIYGPQLYDAYADEYDEEKDSLTNEETLKLLDRIPTGVFQYGRYVVGPSGLRLTEHRRTLHFSARVPAYHCDDPVCRELHSVMLSTGHNAPINSHRSKLRRMLEGAQAQAADWPGLAAEITRTDESYFGNSWTAPMATLVGDCLGDDEVRLLQAMLDGGMDAANQVETGGESLAREVALESLVVDYSDDEIREAIDSLVLSEKIIVPVGEVRVPISTAHLRSGAFRLQPQLGTNGVRFVSGDPGLPTLRERDLFRLIYVDAGDAERHELDWQLRGIDGVSIELRLDEYLRTVPPSEALTRLVLSGSASAIAASELAGAGDFDGATDDKIIARLLWKLGFADRQPEDFHEKFWMLHERLSAAVQSWLGTGPGDEGDFMGRASVYFSELEGRLHETLGFASWALLHDHTASNRSFSFDPEVDVHGGLVLLDQFMRSESLFRQDEKIRFAGRLTMAPLVRGFSALADVLRAISARRPDFERSRSEFPGYAKFTKLQRFPFETTLPFLNLASHSQLRIVDGLAEIEKVLTDASISKVRNSYSHYRRTSPEVAGMAATLEAVGRAIRAIENLGFGLSLCALSGETIDQWGRRSLTFTGPRSLTHVISRPSSLQWAGLPGLDSPQYLVRSAAFDDANEVLRFERRFTSDFSEMWSNYPRPRRATSRTADGSAPPPASA